LSWPKASQEGMEVYSLRLYVAGPMGRSRVALENLKKIFMEILEGKWRIEIVGLGVNRREPGKTRSWPSLP
jgi:hypothetical protein